MDGRGNGEWNKSKKIRERKCLTGIDCIGKWFEKVLCKKADFKRLELRRCPCTYEDSKFNVTKVFSHSQLQFWLVIKLYEAFESLQYDDHVVANPFGCEKMKECLEDPDMNKKDCKRNGSDFHGKKKYCPICDSKTKSISLGSYGRVRFFRMKHNRLKVRIYSWVDQWLSLLSFWLESRRFL